MVSQHGKRSCCSPAGEKRGLPGAEKPSEPPPSGREDAEYQADDNPSNPTAGPLNHAGYPQIVDFSHQKSPDLIMWRRESFRA
jgi:hypothetical protein